MREADLASSRKLIPDLATWWQCFAIYTAVLIEEHLERTKGLLAYGTTIVKARLKYRWPAWIVYDQNFRQEAADNTVTDWSKVDPSIYTQCFTNTAISGENWCRFCQSVEHTARSCPSRPSDGAKMRLLSTPLPPPPAKKRPAPHSVNAACREYNRLDGHASTGRHAYTCTSARGAPSWATHATDAQRRPQPHSDDAREVHVGPSTWTVHSWT